MIGWMTKAAKAVTRMIHSGARWFTAWASREDKYDYRKRVGLGLSASVVMAPIQWLQRAVPEGTIVVEKREDEGEAIPDHPLPLLLRRPNPGYSGDDLVKITVWSLMFAGEAHWIKVRNGARAVRELWWAPWWLMEPRWPEDGSVFISHYEYRPGGALMKLDPADVVHFRCGIDPRNPRRGLSPLAPALREIWSDMEAAGFIASLLRNSGVPGLVLSPDGPVPADKEDVKAIKRYLSEQFTGENRGQPLVMSAKTKVVRIGWNPQELDLSAASDRAEERVCALLGIPASVIGFGSGNEQTKVGATMYEQVKLAWSNAVIPTQTIIAGQIEASLLPDFTKRPEQERIYFDNSEVKALAEDQDKLTARVDRMVQGGWITIAEGRQMVGMESDDTHEIYLRSFGVVEIPGDTGRMPAAEEDEEPDEDDPEPAVGKRRLGKSGKRRVKAHGHSAFSERIARSAPHGEPSADQMRYLRALEDVALKLAGKFTRELTKFFDDMAERGRTVARQVAEDLLKDAGYGTLKDTALNQMVTDRVIEAMNLPLAQRLFREHYERHYLETARRVAGLADMVGLGTNLPDRVGRAVLATGGRRAGLVDLTGQARSRVLQAVAEQRAEGAGIDQIVSAIADAIPAGPWSTSRVRARVIARTETKHAQNISVLEHSRANGVRQFMVHDARLGGDTDEVCEMLDGAIVSAEEASQLMADEHPNGTRSITPHYG